MSGVSLPEFPTGKEFEEYISAILQVSGNYIERNIIDRQGVEVLELDIVATQYNNRLPDIRLFEVKSKEWHFADLFKLRGWMDYLNFDSATFIANGSKDNSDKFKEIANKLNTTAPHDYELS